MRIAVIGLGAGSIGFLNEMKERKDVDITVFEKSASEMDTSLSGIRSDGKLMVSESTGSDINIPIQTQLKARDIYIQWVQIKDALKTYDSFSDNEQYKKFYDNGFHPIKSQYMHIGTDLLPTIVKTILKDLKQSGIKIEFNKEVIAIMKDGHGFWDVGFSDGTWSYKFDKVIVSVGRSGYGLIKKLMDYEPEFVCKNGKQNVDMGVRFECPNFLVDELNSKNYEWKVKYLTRTGYYGRTFCNNPSGQVTMEKYRDIMTVNGHSFNDNKKKSNNTNFAILISSSFTEPFSDPNEYGEYMAKLGNKLAGGKAMLQTVGDFLNFKRTKHIGRVNPTLNEDKYSLCDMNLAFPAKIRESLADFIINLGKVESGILQNDNLIYGIEVKFYSNKMQNRDGVYFVGDCSGHTRSITAASAHGIITAEEILKNI